ncbi:MAG: Co2+/Mg2+ efflux protein ApaG [Mariprofundaceae bacterium]
MDKKLYQIRVDVRSEYAEEHSDATQQHYVFIYHISIRNEGAIAAKLISRHWIITDGEGHVQEVKGEGVVGEQPSLPPGGEHHYNSFCVLETPIGCMQGSYQMLAEDGTRFDAQIAPFSLAVPGSLN